ncbi:hypothetical protein [Streptomyces sp. 130]|uniref:hypothetical protein n=1 Tax=Streptomyces sp. 130 TaxID=2591006 RepID=UPI0021B0F21C|nr:hypothetical protein [Streptomyces sp. 130]
MSAARKTLSSALSAVVLAGGLALGAAGTAHADGCGAARAPKTSGATASWRVTCPTGNSVRVTGWVEDTRMDGDCAVVRVVANSTQKTKKACGSGVREPFAFDFRDPLGPGAPGHRLIRAPHPRTGRGPAPGPHHGRTAGRNRWS